MLEESLYRDYLQPYRIGGMSWRHTPLPEERDCLGTHPTNEFGMGLELARVRELKPGEDRRFYSATHSAQFGKPMGVFFRREVPERVACIVDLPESMAFRNSVKHGMAVKLAVTIGESVLKRTNGEFSAYALSEGARHSGKLQDSTMLAVMMRQFLRCAPRKERGVVLSDAIHQFMEEAYEELIIVCSDFLIQPEDQEWENLRKVCGLAKERRHEVVLVRFLHPEELRHQGGGLTIASASGRSAWAGPGSRRAMERRHREILSKLLSAVRKPHLQFLDLRTDDEAATVLHIKRFFRRRERAAMGMRVATASP